MAAHVDLTKNPKWVHRLLNLFDIADQNKDGLLTIEELMSYANVLSELCNATEEELKVYKVVLKEFLLGIGLTTSGIKRSDWPGLVSKFAASERQRLERGEETLHQKVVEAIFEIVNRDKNGLVSLKELEAYVMSFSVPREAAIYFMEKADSNKDGFLDRNELQTADFNFWFGDPDILDGLYGHII